MGFGRTEMVQVPGSAVEVVDTVGAGDAFSAGLLAWLHGEGRLRRELLDELSSADLTRLLAYANRVSAITCTRAGADPPYRTEVEASTLGTSPPVNTKVKRAARSPASRKRRAGPG